ncbi:MAG: hypothetical protein J2P39_03545 [Candidatus Dormibacteraeota bacterium]|nr:hypothetical protein [Candidatus Dormibacteraeota bacterium]
MSNPMLAPLATLVGEWTVESPLFPGVQGRSVFEWLEDGAYLLQRAFAPDPAPDATWLIGSDDSADHHTALYHDSRGVSRVYQATMRSGTWTIWRIAPGFSQRFTATLSEDGRTLSGSWERSNDGSRWEHDFDLVYRRVGG